MEKLTWIEQILDKWTNLTDKKRITYITGAIIIILGSIIYFGYVHYENKLTEKDNIITTLRNDINSSNIRCDSLLTIEREEKKTIIKDHIMYVEKNEREVKDILFYTNKYKKVKK